MLQLWKEIDLGMLLKRSCITRVSFNCNKHAFTSVSVPQETMWETSTLYSDNMMHYSLTLSVTLTLNKNTTHGPFLPPTHPGHGSRHLTQGSFMREEGCLSSVGYL